jgi:hypothetical protein
MAETEVEIRTFLVIYQCDECVSGIMVYNGRSMPPDKYEHECDECGFTISYDKQYPHRIEKHPTFEGIEGYQ